MLTAAPGSDQGFLPELEFFACLSAVFPFHLFRLSIRIRLVSQHGWSLPGDRSWATITLAERLRHFAAEHDDFRSAVVNEPRGSDVLVGALLCEPLDKSCATGVIFFNNVGYLGMCGHGTIGVVTTLAHMGRIGPGEHRIETPVGVVHATLHPEGSVTVENVASYRHQSGVSVAVEGFGTVSGDIAWGGNWFFLVEDPPLRLDLDNVEQLTEFAWAVRGALRTGGITGARRRRDRPH